MNRGTPAKKASRRKDNRLPPEESVLKAWADIYYGEVWLWSKSYDFYTSPPLIAHTIKRMARSPAAPTLNNGDTK